MRRVSVPFDQWLPDQARFQNSGLVEALNVIARPSGYQPLKAVRELSASGTTFDWTYQQGGYGFFNGTNAGFIYADGSQLIRTNQVGTLTSSGGGTVADPVFARYDDRIFVINGRIASTSTSYFHDSSDDASGFTSVTGLPSAFAMSRVGQFLMVGGLKDSFIEIRWSAYNDPTDWTIDERTQSGSAILDTPELGAITGIVRSRSNLIFQERGVTRIEYVGPPRVFVDTNFSYGIGSVAPKSPITIDDLTYFLGGNGVYMTDGGSVVDIGTGRVNKWLEDNLSGSVSRQSVRAAFDWDTRTITWAWTIPSSAFPGETDPLFVQLHYCIETDTFTRGDENLFGLIPVEDSNGAFIDIGTGVYSLTASSSGRIGATRGDTLAAEMTTGQQMIEPGSRIEVNGFEPQYKGTGATAAVVTQQTIGGATTTGTFAGENAIGVIDARGSGRTAGVSVKFAAGESWSEFAGVVAEIGAGGSR